MGSFAPSLEADAKRFGFQPSRIPYPSGIGGTHLSLTEVARRVVEGSKAPSIMQFAEATVRGWARIPVSQKISNRQAAQIFLDFVRANIRYRPDPPGLELTKSATISLCVQGAQMCIPVGDCFPEGTLLLRDDFSLVPVEKIAVGERIWGRDKWTTVEATAFKGTLRVDGVEMNNGSTMYLTPGHQVYIGRCRHGKGPECPTCPPSHRIEKFERVRVSDLQEGETLLQPEKIDFGVGEIDPDRAYVEGLALADGWVRDNCKCFYISGKDGFRKEKQKHEVKAICEKLGIRTLWHKRYITVFDEVWANRLARLGARARFKHIETLNLTEVSAEAMLRGVMADSTPSTSRAPEGARTYSTTSPLMVTQVRVLHRMFGRSASLKMLTPAQHGGAGKHPLWRLGLRQPGNRADKTLTVREIERSVQKLPCWDIQTEDHYVYLPEHDVTVSNCDDLTVALGALCASYGIPVRLLKQIFGSNEQEHILVEIQTESGEWLPADPSADVDKPVGWKSPGATQEDIIDPSDPASIKLIGANEAEFIGVGSLGRIPTVLAMRMPRSIGGLVRLGATAVATTPGATYSLVLDKKVQAAKRYRVGVLVNFINVPANVLPTDYVKQFFAPDWAIETLAASGDVTGGIQSWIMQGIAGRDMTLVDSIWLTYVAIAVEGSPVSGGAAAPAPVAGVGAASLAVKGAAVVAAGTLAWMWWKAGWGRR